MSNGTVCPCESLVFPSEITNLPGLVSIAYRVGDFTSFRQALLVLARPGEVELTNWRPSATQDLAVQMVEWWAYLADILTFYNERIANQNYLGTADLPESVSRLIQVLGYRPRPGIGARGTLAVLLSKQMPLTVPKGFQVQSKPGPGQSPQVFEVEADTTINPPDSVPADFAPNPSLLQADPSSGLSSVLLAGTITSLTQGDELLLLERGWNGSDQNWALTIVQSSTLIKDSRGKVNTSVTFAGPVALPAGAAAAGYRLLRSNQFARPWQPADPTITLQANQVDLDSIVRPIKPGDPVLFEAPTGSAGPLLVSITSYTEVVWYTNADPKHPDQSPDPTVTPPIPIPHSRITFNPSQTAGWDLKQLLVRFDWQDVGSLIATPAATLSATVPTLVASAPASFPSGGALPLLVEDANGIGVSALGTVAGSPPELRLSQIDNPSANLTPPLNVLYGLVSVSRGKIVVGEILGSGDATQPGQDFELQNSPLTYLPGPSSGSGPDYQSTLQVQVNGIAWQEVPSFYGQAPDAQVFVTREDENNKTHVLSGDGTNGARFPSGTNNIVATYRFGSGASSPPAGSLTVVLQPRPNLKAVHNPVAVGGGSDPDPPAQIRRYAPQSVLCFGRAISADDYETIAAQAPGVARARSYWAWDPIQQRTLVTIYVGDDANAVSAAQTALALADDPNRPVVVKLATPVPVSLSLTLLIDRRYDQDAGVLAVTSALLDPQSGLLGASIQIGQAVYDSQIYAACLSVPGVVAVHALVFSLGSAVDANPSHQPGPGGFLQLTNDNLVISTEVATNAG